MVAAARIYNRVSVDVAVEFVDKATGESFVGRATNISIGGACVETGAYLPFGAAVTVFMRLPGSSLRLPFEAVVRWNGDTGMGLQFQALSVRQTHLIASLYVHRTTVDGNDVAWIG